jgi:calpain-7
MPDPMADKAAQLAAFKQTADDCQAQLPTAATKKEALNCAISAADSLMKALRLSSNPDEKKLLKAQFTAAVDAADRIKTARSWSPQLGPQPSRQTTKSDMIGQWAVDVSQTAPSQSLPAPVDSTFAGAQFWEETSAPKPLHHQTHDVNQLPTSPSIASYSHLRRLAEPVSTRKRAKKEEIILLKASVIDGFKCPPWDRPPMSTEFVLNHQSEPFT